MLLRGLQSGITQETESAGSKQHRIVLCAMHSVFCCVSVVLTPVLTLCQSLVVIVHLERDVLTQEITKAREEESVDYLVQAEGFFLPAFQYLSKRNMI